MRSLYLVEPGSRLSKDGERLVIDLEGNRMEAVRPDELAQCVVLGNAGITTPALHTLLGEGTDVVFLSRSGRFLGRLSSGLSKNIELRRRQFGAFNEPGRALGLARRFVVGKVENQRLLLRRRQKKRQSEKIATALLRLRNLQAEIPIATSLDSLRGLEGSAAAEYFGCLGELFTAPGISFERRLRRPPPDPVNVLLSFGYTLLGNLVHAAVETAGLDPFLGCLHEPRYGRPSLVLDLVEEFRPLVVDAAVLRTVNTRAVTAQDFVRLSDEADGTEERWEREEYAEGDDTDGKPPRRMLIFSKIGVKKWLAEFERRLSERAFYPPRGLRLALRDIVGAQVYRLCADLRGEESYEAFTMPV